MAEGFLVLLLPYVCLNLCTVVLSREDLGDGEPAIVVVVAAKEVGSMMAQCEKQPSKEQRVPWLSPRGAGQAPK